MRNRLSPLVAFALMLMLAAPALAQKGDTQDNQQQGSGKGATVTKTFELTLNGDVPADRAFAVFYGTEEEFGADEPQDVIFCGQPTPQEGDVVVSDDDCVGGGNVYSYSVELPRGTELYFSYVTAVEGDEEETIEFFFGNITFEGAGDPEVLNSDMTNTGYYTFGGGKGAGDQQDDQQDDQQGGAGDAQDDQQGGAGDVQDNQQEDTQDNQQDGGAGDTQDNQQDEGAGDVQDDQQDDGAGDMQDDQQDEDTGDTQDDEQDMPMLPATGAGGLAGGASMLPYAVAGLALLVAGGYTRRRR